VMAGKGPLPKSTKLTLADQAPPDRCIATTTAGVPCKAYPMNGSVLCRRHLANWGGPLAVQKDRKVRRNGLAYSTLVEHPKLYNPDARPITDPVVTLQWLAGVQREAIEFIGQMVNERERRITYLTGEGVENLRADVAFYERMIAQFQKLLTDMTKLGIEAKKAAMIDEYSSQVVAAFRVVLNGLALTPEQREASGPLVARELTAIAERDAARELSKQIVEGQVLDDA
jgi:hypothetical protein